MPKSNKTKIQKQFRPKNRGQQPHLTVRGCFIFGQSINATSTADSLGAIQPLGIFGYSSNLNSLCDMFRLYRVNKLKFDMRPSPEDMSATYQQIWSPSVLFLSFFGATAPTSISDVENYPCGPWADGFVIGPTQSTAGPVLTGSNALKLTLRHSDFPVINSADPPGWLATQSDGSQTGFGTVYRLAPAGSSVTNTALNWYVKVEFDISFLDLLDPGTISAAVAAGRGPNCTIHEGAVAAWTLKSMSFTKPAKVEEDDTDANPSQFVITVSQKGK